MTCRNSIIDTIPTPKEIDAMGTWRERLFYKVREELWRHVKIVEELNDMLSGKL